MAAISISLPTVIDWATNRVLDAKQPPIPADQRQLMFRVSKFNHTLMAFNASSVLLIIALAAAILFSLHLAVVLGAIAIFARLALLKEMHTLTEPDDENQVMRHAMNYLIGRHNDPNQSARIFNKLGIEPIRGWNKDRLIIFDNLVWVNPLPMAQVRARGIF